MPISKVGSAGIKDANLSADDLAPGSVTNAKLAGSISNDKLANSSVTLNGTAVSLGGSADIGTQWQSVITADGSTTTTAVAGEGYFIDTSSAAHTINLPASPSIGDTVIISQLNGANTITVGRNSSNINGSAADTSLTSDGDSLTLVYSNASEGWKTVNSTIGGTFIQATGGTETTSGDYKIHTFTTSGCFVVSAVGNGASVPAGGPSGVDYLVVAGGGGGGAGGGKGGGGGAGGLRASQATYTIGCAPASPLASPTAITVVTSAYPITVGAGGSGGPRATSGNGTSGSNSVFSTITSAGGGYGGAAVPSSGGNAGANGGSGGGGGVWGSTPGGGGTGNTPPVSPPQGNSGGAAQGSPEIAGGGGGAGGAGNGTAGSGKTGGDGVGFPSAFGTSGESSSPYYYFSGGGGGGQYPGESSAIGGGLGGGGDGGAYPEISGAGAGTANTGGGGGGGIHSPSSLTGSGAAGGSGIVILRYKYQ